MYSFESKSDEGTEDDDAAPAVLVSDFIVGKEGEGDSEVTKIRNSKEAYEAGKGSPVGCRYEGHNYDDYVFIFVSSLMICCTLCFCFMQPLCCMSSYVLPEDDAAHHYRRGPESRSRRNSSSLSRALLLLSRWLEDDERAVFQLSRRDWQ